MVSKQSVEYRYVTEITVVSCSDRHTSLGNWKRSRLRASNSRRLEPKATTLTTTPPSQPSSSSSSSSSYGGRVIVIETIAGL